MRWHRAVRVRGQQRRGASAMRARARGGLQRAAVGLHVVGVDCEQDVPGEGVDIILLVAPSDVGQHGLIRQLDQLAVVRDRLVPLAWRQRLGSHVHSAAKRRHAALCCSAPRLRSLLLRNYGQGQLTPALDALLGHAQQRGSVECGVMFVRGCRSPKSEILVVVKAVELHMDSLCGPELLGGRRPPFFLAAQAPNESFFSFFCGRALRAFLRSKISPCVCLVKLPFLVFFTLFQDLKAVINTARCPKAVVKGRGSPPEGPT